MFRRVAQLSMIRPAIDDSCGLEFDTQTLNALAGEHGNEEMSVRAGFLLVWDGLQAELAVQNAKDTRSLAQRCSGLTRSAPPQCDR